MKTLRPLIFLFITPLITAQTILYEGEISIHIINVTFPPNLNYVTVQFQANRIFDAKWYPDLYPNKADRLIES